MADLFKKKTPDATAPENNAAPTDGADKKKEKKAKPQKKTYLESNQMNFLERYEVVVEGKEHDVNLKPVLTVAIAIIAVLVVAFVGIKAIDIFMGASNKKLNAYINDSTNVASYNDAISVKAKIDGANAQKGNLESLINAIQTYPSISKDFFSTISTASSANGVKVETYGYTSSSGLLSVSCTATAPQNISDFVRAMTASGLFTSIEYTGFSGGSEGGYTFNLICYCVGTK